MARSMGIRTNVLELMKIKGDPEKVAHNPQRDRFKMSFAADTSIRKDLNANRIIINDHNIAIATQYPFPNQIEAQLQMLVDNRTPALIILASHSDIKNNGLPDYFSKSGVFGQIQTSSAFVHSVELGNAIGAKVYHLEIAGYKATIDMPVIHVFNWPDHQTVSQETTTNLVSLIESKVGEKRAFYEEKKSRAIDDPEKLLPVIHCRAGVGRTGQTIAAMAMKKNPELNLASITKDLRQSRNNFMIQTPYQMETLLRMELGSGLSE